MARQGVVQYTATQGQTGPFLCPFYVYDVAYLSVYRTPAGNAPNDAANLLNSSQYTGTNSSDPNSSYITLITPANAGDVITVFYEFADATVIPKYPYCSSVDSTADGILPVLPPNNVWIKSSDGSKITTAVIPGLASNIPVVSSSPITNTIVKFTSDSTSPISIRNSNTTLTPIRLASGSYYDNVTGVHNLSMVGGLTVGSIDTSSLDNYKLVVSGSAIASSVEVAYSLVLRDLSNINKTYISSPEQYNDTITYTLPESQAAIPASLLANDANGNLSWLPQTGINQVGTITQGSWNAGNVTVPNGTVAASVGIFSSSQKEYNNDIYPSSFVSTNALILEDGTGQNSTAIASPISYNGNYIYVLPPSMGATGQVLKIQDTHNSSNTSVATLTWSTPASATILPATSSQVQSESQSGVYVDPTTLHNHKGIAKAWIRFHNVTNSDGTIDPIISDYYFVDGVPSTPIVRVGVGIYDINFYTNFTSGLTYSVIGTGFYTTSGGLVTVAQYAADNTGHGEDPQPGSCRIAILDKNGNLTDAANPAGYPTPPDIYVAFFGY